MKRESVEVRVARAMTHAAEAETVAGMLANRFGEVLRTRMYDLILEATKQDVIGARPYEKAAALAKVPGVDLLRALVETVPRPRPDPVKAPETVPLVTWEIMSALERTAREGDTHALPYTPAFGASVGTLGVVRYVAHAAFVQELQIYLLSLAALGRKVEIRGDGASRFTLYTQA